jgi:hypothetical protein
VTLKVTIYFEMKRLFASNTRALGLAELWSIFGFKSAPKRWEKHRSPRQQSVSGSI